MLHQTTFKNMEKIANKDALNTSDALVCQSASIVKKESFIVFNLFLKNEHSVVKFIYISN